MYQIRWIFGYLYVFVLYLRLRLDKMASRVDNKMVNHALSRIGLILLLLAFLSPISAGLTLTEGVELQASDGSGVYNITKTNGNISSIVINSTTINVSGMASTTDVIYPMNGTVNYDAGSEVLLDNISSNVNVMIDDMLSLSGVTILNITGSADDMVLCVDTDGGSLVVELNAHNQGNCSYNVNDYLNYLNNVSNISYGLNGPYDFCNLTVLIKDGDDQCFSLTQNTTEKTELAALLAALSATVVVVVKSYQWDSVT